MKTLYTISLFFFLCCTTQAQIITTVAGGDTIGIGDGGQATACELYSPISVVFDTAGNYYVTARDENRVRKVAPDGIITTIAGNSIAGFSGDNGPATAAELNGPYGLAMDAAGNIYFSDTYNNRVRKISTEGIITTIAGTGIAGHNGDNIQATSAELNKAGGVAVDSKGNIYVAEYGNSRVRKIEASGIITTIAGNDTVGYNGDEIPATNAELYFPNGIAFDRRGNLYITESDRIMRIDTAGIIHTFAGGSHGYGGDNGPATDAQLSQPFGVYADPWGNVYIGDTYNSVVRKVNAAGIITTIAGNGISGDSGDGGLATWAELGEPVGITTDAAGNVYIADGGDNRVRRITSTVSVPQVIATDELQVYPNPNDGELHVRIAAATNEQVSITITDVTGHSVQQVQGMTNVTINIKTDAPPGVYLLYATTGSGVLMQKIVKQ